MNNSTQILLMCVIVVVAFLIVSAIVMALYNHTVPKLVMSVNNTYKSSDFTPIDFGTACTLVLLCGLLFGSSTVCTKSYSSKSYSSKF